MTRRSPAAIRWLARAGVGEDIDSPSPELTEMHAVHLDDPTPTDVITFDLGDEGEGPAGEDLELGQHEVAMTGPPGPALGEALVRQHLDAQRRDALWRAVQRKAAARSMRSC